jgi:hypothetical protein
MIFRWLTGRGRNSVEPRPPTPLALTNVARMRSAGVTHGKWLYSGAPCYATSAPTAEQREMDAAHRGASGKVFPLDKGMRLNRTWTFPGLEPGCKCVTNAVVPGFD